MRASNGLPAGLGEPLHLLEPSNDGLWLGSLLATLLGLLLTWLWRRWRNRRPVITTPIRKPTPVVRDRSGPILETLAELRKRHGQAKSFREGCHELASTLRQYFERRASSPGAPMTTLTARELGDRLADPFIGSLFVLLEELQFRRREPGSSDFYGVCDMATEALEGRAGGSGNGGDP